MNPSEEKLSRALRDLADVSPQEAPTELGMKLAGAFRQHHHRRRQWRMAGVAAIAVCLVSVVGWLWTHRETGSHTAAVKPPQAIRQPAPPQLAATLHGGASGVESPRPAGAHRLHSRKSESRPGRPSGPTQVADAAEASAGQFVVLPLFDPDVPVGQSRMVRLEVSGASLRLVGYPVDEELAERRVVTDVLLAQDGTPYAVRLVRTKTIH